MPESTGDDARRVETAGECLWEIKATFDEVANVALAFYIEHLQSSPPLPGLAMRTGLADGQNTAFPGRVLAFNAAVRYEKEDETIEGNKRSVVNVRVSPADLDRGDLPTLPYILAHEILCHWPQMAWWPGARPSPKLIEHPDDKRPRRFEVDPISEGWMDSLVGLVLRRRPNGANRLGWEEVATADTLHNERVQVGRKPYFAEAERIAPGDYAAKLVEWLYATDQRGNPMLADLDFRRLSCELNVASWSYGDRMAGFARIVEGCEAYIASEKRLEELPDPHWSVICALLEFRDSHNVTPVLQALGVH